MKIIFSWIWFYITTIFLGISAIIKDDPVILLFYFMGICVTALGIFGIILREKY